MSHEKAVQRDEGCQGFQQYLDKNQRERKALLMYVAWWCRTLSFLADVDKRASVRVGTSGEASCWVLKWPKSVVEMKGARSARRVEIARKKLPWFTGAH